MTPALSHPDKASCSAVRATPFSGDPRRWHGDPAEVAQSVEITCIRTGTSASRVTAAEWSPATLRNYCIAPAGALEGQVAAVQRSLRARNFDADGQPHWRGGASVQRRRIGVKSPGSPGQPRSSRWLTRIALISPSTSSPCSNAEEAAATPRSRRLALRPRTCGRWTY